MVNFPIKFQFLIMKKENSNKQSRDFSRESLKPNMQRTSNKQLGSTDSQVKQEAGRQTEWLEKSEANQTDIGESLKLIVYVVDEENQVITHYASDPYFDQEKIFNSKMYREYYDDNRR